MQLLKSCLISRKKFFFSKLLTEVASLELVLNGWHNSGYKTARGAGFSKSIIADCKMSTQFIEANTTEEPQRSQWNSFPNCSTR